MKMKSQTQKLIRQLTKSLTDKDEKLFSVVLVRMIKQNLSGYAELLINSHLEGNIDFIETIQKNYRFLPLSIINHNGKNRLVINFVNYEKNVIINNNDVNVFSNVSSRKNSLLCGEKS